MSDPAARLPLGESRTWLKSSFSGAGDCVEVAFAPDGAVHVRDSKDVVGPQLHFNSREWAAFLAGVRDGQFDLPSPG
jgi:hypothetical protein